MSLVCDNATVQQHIIIVVAVVITMSGHYPISEGIRQTNSTLCVCGKLRWGDTTNDVADKRQADSKARNPTATCKFSDNSSEESDGQAKLGLIGP